MYRFVCGVKSTSDLFANQALVYLAAVSERVEHRIQHLLGLLHLFFCWMSWGLVLDVLEAPMWLCWSRSRAWGGCGGQEVCLSAWVWVVVISLVSTWDLNSFPLFFPSLNGWEIRVPAGSPHV